jgi:uncharacterized protein
MDSAAPPAGSPPAKPCPICARPMEQKYRPFCSKRCADVDLGRWFKGSYAIPGEAIPQGDDELDRPRDGDGH